MILYYLMLWWAMFTSLLEPTIQYVWHVHWEKFLEYTPNLPIWLHLLDRAQQCVYTVGYCMLQASIGGILQQILPMYTSDIDSKLNGNRALSCIYLLLLTLSVHIGIICLTVTESTDSVTQDI